MKTMYNNYRPSLADLARALDQIIINPPRICANPIKSRLKLALLLSCFISVTGLQAQDNNHQGKGKSLAFDKKRGNCLACHAIDDGENIAALGPPLENLQLRFSNKSALKTYIWDASSKKPNTIMPAFGKQKILSDKEIELIVNYLWRL